MIYTGLDISTSIVGYSSVDENGKLINYGHLNLSKVEGLYDKIEVFEQSLSAMPFSDIVAVEDILTRFVSGKSSAKIIIKLAQFNALCCDRCYSKFGHEPLKINVTRARNLAMDGIPPRGVNTKEYVLEWVMRKYPHIEMPRMKRKDAIAKDAYDIADSIIVALALRKLDEENSI